ncbi:hypothetical protein Tco_0815913 [Tanacetum coccineum]
MIHCSVEISSLKLRVNKLEKQGGSRTHKLKRLYKVGRSARIVSSKEASLGDHEDASKQGRKIDDIDADEGVTLVDETVENRERINNEEMFDTGVLNDEEVFIGQDMAKKEVSTTDPVTTAGEVVTTASVEVSTASLIADELTLAQTLIEIKSAKPKAKGVMIGERERRKAYQGKAQKVEEVNIAWDDIQAKVEADYPLAQRLQAQEQEVLSDAEKATLFVQLLEKRRKHFAAKRAEAMEEKKNRPPTKA